MKYHIYFPELHVKEFSHFVSLMKQRSDNTSILLRPSGLLVKLMSSETLTSIPITVEGRCQDQNLTLPDATVQTPCTCCHHQYSNWRPTSAIEILHSKVPNVWTLCPWYHEKHQQHARALPSSHFPAVRI